MTEASATEPSAAGDPAAKGDRSPMTDLSTTYMGLELAHPIMASASPLTGSVEGLLALEEAGAAAVVLPSLFEEQVEYDTLAYEHFGPTEMGFHPEAHAGYFPALDDYNTGADEYLDLLVAAKSELSIPVIASLNGVSQGGWTRYASALEGEGADAIELNIYRVAADADVVGHQIETYYTELVEEMRAEIDIPLAIKVGPFFSSPANMARHLVAAGADALVLFNRFYQPDIDLETLEVVPNLQLSTETEMRLVLRWMAILRGQIDADLAATTGVHSAEGAVKLTLAGADVIMMASHLLQHGPGALTAILDDYRAWFTERGYASVEQAKGSVSQGTVSDPSAFERANYMKVLTSWGAGV